MAAKYNQILVERGLYEERAIILSRLGRHDAALEEYTHSLFDFKVAEEYCAKHYDPDKEENRDIYLSLLQVYLKKPRRDTNGAMATALRDAAFDLLIRHYKEIDTPRALEILPRDTTIQSLFPYLVSVFRDMNDRKRNNQVEKNILRAESMKVKGALLKYHAQAVVVSESTFCAECDRAIGRNVAFVRYPNGDIVHYNCFRRKEDERAEAQKYVL